MSEDRRRAAAGSSTLLAACLTLACLAPAAPAAAKPGLALGDDRTSPGTAERGRLLSCTAPARTGAAPLPWVGPRRWLPAAKPVVDGSVSWPGASFARRPTGSGQSFESQGLPVEGATGVFPAEPGDDAAPYAPSRAIVAGAVSGALPAPVRRRKPACVALDQPIGIAVNGVPILAPTDASGRDLVARQVTDSCGGVVTADGTYAYRTLPTCLYGNGGRGSLIGWARDGFPILGPGPGKRRSAARGLDACNGHKSRFGYRYRASFRFPYLVGCFRGTPAPWTAAGGDAPAATAVTASPALFPAYDPGVSDYVVRCQGPDVRLSVDAAPGETVSVDGAAPAGGEFDRAVPLQPDQAFTFTRRSGGVPTTHHVRCLPTDFPMWNYERMGDPSQDLYVVAPTRRTDPGTGPYIVAFDDRGVPVWWFGTPVSIADAKVLSDGRFAWARADTAGYEIRDLDGSLEDLVSFVNGPTDEHDFQEAGNGNHLVMSYKQRGTTEDLTPIGGPANATVRDSAVQEIDPDGNVVWSWNSKDHIALDEITPNWRASGIANGDLVHMNSIELAGDSLIVSLRRTDSVYGIDRATGDVEWKLGGTTTPESLTVVGDPHASSPVLGQHDARILPDGSLTVHDNGTSPPRQPRAVRYAIDEGARTATLLEAVADPDVPLAGCCGSARRSPGGNWLMSWGQVSSVTEFGPGGDRVFRLTFGNPFSYRAFPVPDGTLSKAALRAGMTTMNPR